MHSPSVMQFQRQGAPFGWLRPPEAQLSPGPKALPGSRPRVAVLHQGHVSNHHALRTELQDRGYRFQSPSDGELIAHLIDAIHGGDARQALRRAAALLQGPNAFVVQFHDQAERLLATRRGPVAALHWHPQRVELIVPPPLASANNGHSAGLHWLPEGEILDLEAGPHRSSQLL